MNRETALEPLRRASSRQSAGGERVSAAIAIFARVFQEIRPRTPVPPIQLRFVTFANANCFIQLKHGELEVRLSDVLETAPDDVLESLACILLSKLYRRPAPKEMVAHYRRYLSKKPVRTAISNLRQERGRKAIAPPQGRCYDLIEVFEALNFKYFHGLMARPELGWSLRASRQTLGHYDSVHHTIVLNRILDSESTPRLAVEFVMYHEMLHVKHPVEHRGARRCVHTKEFQAAEREFEGYEEARAMLRKL